MSTFEETSDLEYEPYRTVSKTAVLSMILAVGSLIGFLFWPALMLALPGCVFGAIGYRSIRRYPLELSGKAPSIAGFTLSLLVLIGGGTYHSVVFATEVPGGCTRISFDDLQPIRERPDLPISPLAVQLNGKRVFIKGYVYPGNQRHGIKRFILVNDMGTCCFGGQPKLTHMVEVTLEDPLRVDYSYKKRKLAGVLEVDTRPKSVGKLGGVFFQLKADFLQ